MLSSSAFTGAAGRSGLFSDPTPRSPVNRKRLDGHFHHAPGSHKRVRFRADVKVRLRPSASNLRPLSRLAAKRDDISDPPIAALDTWDLAWREYLGEYYDDHMFLIAPHDDAQKMKNYLASREHLMLLAKQLGAAQTQWAAGMQAADQAELDALPPADAGLNSANYHAQMAQLLNGRAAVLSRLVSAAQYWQDIEMRRWAPTGEQARPLSGAAAVAHSLFGGKAPSSTQSGITPLGKENTFFDSQFPRPLDGPENATDRSIESGAFSRSPSSSSLALLTHEGFCEFVDQVDAYQKKYKRMCDSVRRIQRKARRHRPAQQSNSRVPAASPTTSFTPAPTLENAAASALAAIGILAGRNSGTGSSTPDVPSPTAGASHQAGSAAPADVSTTGAANPRKSIDAESLLYQPTVGASGHRSSLGSFTGKMRIMTATVAKKSPEGDLGRFAFPPIRRRASSAVSSGSWITTSSGIGGDYDAEASTSSSSSSSSSSLGDLVPPPLVSAVATGSARKSSSALTDNNIVSQKGNAADSDYFTHPILPIFADDGGKPGRGKAGGIRNQAKLGPRPTFQPMIYANTAPSGPRSEVFSHTTACYHFLN